MCTHIAAAARDAVTSTTWGEDDGVEMLDRAARHDQLPRRPGHTLLARLQRVHGADALHDLSAVYDLFVSSVVPTDSPKY